VLGRICEEFGCLPFPGAAAEQPLALLNDITDMRAYVEARKDIYTPGKSDFPDDEAHQWATRVMVRRRTGRWVWG
jgi:hypothetical protein